MQLDPAALEPDLVVSDAEPPDESATGVAGAVPGQRAGHHDVADDPRVDFPQISLGNHTIGAPDGALGGYPGQLHPPDQVRVDPEMAHHLSVGARLGLHENADYGHGLWRADGHAAQSGFGLVWVAQIFYYPQYRAQYEARQMLLDQVVLSLIAFSFFQWVGPRSSDHYALRF